MTQILDLTRRYLQRVRMVGPENITALCPFHSERDPSFSMNILTGLYLCFSCGEKGNLRKFLLSVGVDQHTLETQYGKLISETDKNRPAPPDPIRPQAMVEEEPLPEDILGLFSGYPRALLEVGFTRETLEHFQVGFDKWHMRIVYPLRNLRGQLVGLSGRSVNEDGARYKVYKDEYLTWNLPMRQTRKGTFLWHAHEVYPRVFPSTVPQPVVVVEGFKACMWIYQAGISDVLALMGSHLSWEQKWILQRMGGPVHLMLDNNEAGYQGTLKAAQQLMTSLPVRIVEYEGEQPDNVEPGMVPELITQARDVYQLL